MFVHGEEVTAVWLLLPVFAPASVTCEAPFDAVLPEITTAPTGAPATQPGTETGMPVKKKPARE